MKPVAIFRHSPTEGPGYFGDYLDARSVPWKLIALDAGEPVPSSPGEYAGLVFMGGPMSVNDDLPWIPKVLELIRKAAAENVPTLGHCLGGQLISKALGGVVTRNPKKEIGWGAVVVDDNPVARKWFGDIRSFETFQWHGETFSLPPNATRLMSSPYCSNQGFAIGPHLGMQCHVEMTEQMIDNWCRDGQTEIAANRGPSVQTEPEMKANAERKLDALHAVAGRLYDRWLEGLKP
jgi:GMP synthase-like glutamine amidotransferase